MEIQSNNGAQEDLANHFGDGPAQRGEGNNCKQYQESRYNKQQEIREQRRILNDNSKDDIEKILLSRESSYSAELTAACHDYEQEGNGKKKIMISANMREKQREGKFPL